MIVWKKEDRHVRQRDYAPVAQGIEHRPPEAGAAVRIRPGVYFCSYSCMQRYAVCMESCRI